MKFTNFFQFFYECKLYTTVLSFGSHIWNRAARIRGIIEKNMSAHVSEKNQTLHILSESVDAIRKGEFSQYSVHFIIHCIPDIT
jgi:hypothetical protein